MLLAVACTGLFAPDAHADGAKVFAVSANCDFSGLCSFDVTVQHPDTGSLGGVEVPAAAASLRVRAHCSKDGYVGREFEVRVPRLKRGSKGD